MADLYFACDWIIIPVGNFNVFDHVNNTVAELGGELMIVKSLKPTSEGYYMTRYAIRIPSKAALDEFVERAGKQMNLIDWYPISEDYYSQGAKAHGFDNLPFNMQTGVIDEIMDMARKNERLRKELEGRGKM